MSLLRLAFWLAVLVLLLPTNAEQQARFAGLAGGAYERAATFCDRNGRACSAAAEAWTAFLRKAEFGFRLVGDLLGAGGPPRRADGAPARPAPERRLGRAPGGGPPPDLDRLYWQGRARPPPRENYY